MRLQPLRFGLPSSRKDSPQALKRSGAELHRHD
jgi:hypothetical protein